jgi:tRNA A-37 threonylcarbamoyl transferase component Bud32
MEVYIKNNVSLHEYQMHKYIYELEIVNVPKIVAYDFERNILVMEKIKNMSLSDFYGENSENIISELFTKIRSIIKKLLENNIEYPDITGYNFIESDNKIWIIDFEHSSVITRKEIDPFVIKFVNGLNEWNPYFK